MQLFLTYPKKNKLLGYFLLAHTLFWVHFLCCYPLFAQSVSPTAKDYLIESYKNRKTTATILAADNLHTKTDHTYRFIKVNYKSELQMDIRPMRTEKLPQKKLYGNYIKVGLGNYQHSYAEAFFNTRRSEKYSYGLHIKHTNTGKGAVDGRNSADAQNQLLFNFQSATRKGIILGKLGLQCQQWHFYGYQPTAKVPKAQDIQQNFGILDGQIGYTNKYSANKYSYDVGLSYYYLADYYAAKEQEIGVSLANKVRFDAFNYLHFRAEMSSSLRSDEAGSLRRDLLVGELYHQFSNQRIFLQVGGRAAVHNDTLKAIQKVHFYPKVAISLNFLNNKFDVYAHLEGDMQKRLLRNMLLENPYLAPNTPLLHTNKAWEGTVGLRTKLKGVFNWQASASYGRYQYLHFFMNSPLSPEQFLVQYETASIPVTTLTNEVMLNYGKFRTKLHTQVQKYELQTLENAWHRPLLKNTLSLAYIKNNLICNVDFYHLAGIAAFDIISSEQKELPPIIDLNIKIDYQLSPLWSLFIKGSNLLAQHYQRYLYYDIRTAQISGGASLTF
jgi:hypothetical protein